MFVYPGLCKNEESRRIKREIEKLTEKRRIENARTPIKMRMKKDRTFPNASLRVDPLEGSEAAMDGQIEGLS